MKKFIRVCMLLAALSAMLCASALAADMEITNKVAANSNSSSVVTEGDAAGKFNVSYDRAAEGGEHLILMVAANLEGAEPAYTITDTSILYINQATASAAGQVDFEVYPSAVKDSVILLAGAEAQPVVLATIDVAGVKVSGSTTSWNSTKDTVYRLYESTATNDAIKADVKLATPALALDYTAKVGDPTADGGQFDQTFSFEGVPSGSYKLAIYKPGKYVPKIIEITIKSEDIALEEVKLWLYGDVDYSGELDATDATQILRYFNSKEPNAFTLGAVEDLTDRLICADIDGSEELDATDATQILRYFNNKTPNLFENII